MTHLAGGSPRRIPRAWLIPLAAAVAILVSVAAGYLSRSVVIDLLAWWPAWLLLAILAFLAGGRRWGKVRFAGLVPLLAFAVVGVFLTGHLEGWPAMPSSSLRLVGPEVGTGTVAAVSARIDGDLRVNSAALPFLYRVIPIRRGGSVAMANATEQVQGATISVDLRPVADPGAYTFSGWDVVFAEDARWAITLGGMIEADLSGLAVTELQLAGDGRVVLGEATGPAGVTVEGGFELVVPRGMPMRVIGDASVPVGWEEASDGWMAPADGEGWMVSVAAGATLVVSNP